MRSHLQTVIRRLRELIVSSELEDQLALKCLVENVSFRLPASSAKDRLIGFKTLLRLSASIWKSHSQLRIHDSTGQSAIIELTDRFEKLEIEYVTKQSDRKVKLYLNKHHFYGLTGKGQRLGIILRLWSFGFFNAIKCVSSSSRANLAMIPVHLAEIASLMHVFEHHEIEHVYDFAPYDVDGNFSYLVFREAGIQVSKLPSPGPLTTHNHTLFADELILSCEYQFDEIKTLPNIVAGETLKWLPEYAFQYIDKYVENAPQPEQGTVGYYSHASWLRSAQDHSETEIKVEEAEDLVLGFLDKYLSKSGDGDLVIFLHPREKSEDLFPQVQDFYSSRLKKIKFTFADKNMSTAEAFGKVDIGVAAFSTVLYERLFCGYKTLICNHGAPGFPIPETSLNGICFTEEPQMKILMDKVRDQSRDEFFSSNGLKGYRFSDYPYFSQSL